MVPRRRFSARYRRLYENPAARHFWRFQTPCRPASADDLAMPPSMRPSDVRPSTLASPSNTRSSTVALHSCASAQRGRAPERTCAAVHPSSQGRFRRDFEQRRVGAVRDGIRSPLTVGNGRPRGSATLDPFDLAVRRRSRFRRLRPEHGFDLCRGVPYISLCPSHHPLSLEWARPLLAAMSGPSSNFNFGTRPLLSVDPALAQLLEESGGGSDQGDVWDAPGRDRSHALAEAGGISSGDERPIEGQASQNRRGRPFSNSQRRTNPSRSRPRHRLASKSRRKRPWLDGVTAAQVTFRSSSAAGRKRMSGGRPSKKRVFDD